MVRSASAADTDRMITVETVTKRYGKTRQARPPGTGCRSSSSPTRPGWSGRRASGPRGAASASTTTGSTIGRRLSRSYTNAARSSCSSCWSMSISRTPSRAALASERSVADRQRLPDGRRRSPPGGRRVRGAARSGSAISSPFPVGCGHQSGGRGAAVPRGRVELRLSWWSSIRISALAMCRAACCANCIISTAPIAKLGAMKMFGARCEGPAELERIEPGRPDHDVDTCTHRLLRVLDRGRRDREVDEHVGLGRERLRHRACPLRGPHGRTAPYPAPARPRGTRSRPFAPQRRQRRRGSHHACRRDRAHRVVEPFLARADPHAREPFWGPQLLDQPGEIVDRHRLDPLDELVERQRLPPARISEPSLSSGRPSIRARGRRAL